MGPVEPRPLQSPVFAGSAVVAFGLIAFVLRDPARGRDLRRMQNDVTAAFGWLYRYSITTVLLFSLLLLASRHGHLRLGREDDQPSIARMSWYAMMFGAGMGIGLLFWSVSEPLAHFAQPPAGAGGTAEGANVAMRLTFFHWGLHAWAVYAIVGLGLAYFGYRRGLPLTMLDAVPAARPPHLRLPGHVVDIIGVVATLFGVATSLGLGAIQFNAGLNYLFGVPVSPFVQLGSVAVVTAVGTWALAQGLERASRRSAGSTS